MEWYANVICVSLYYHDAPVHETDVIGIFKPRFAMSTMPI